MDIKAFMTFAVAMLTILNPVGNAAVFAGMVAGRPAAERRAIIRRCTLAVAIILVATVWGGEQLLALFGVSVPSLEASGGLVILLIALAMLRSAPSGMHTVTDRADDPGPGQGIALVPLAIPMVAGPGAIATVIVHTHRHQGPLVNLEMSLVCVAMAMIVGLGFRSADRTQRLLGEAGMDVIAKLMGLVLLAIAVGMIATGLKGLFPALAAD